MWSKTKILKATNIIVFSDAAQCWKFPQSHQSEAYNFGGGPETFCWFFFKFMFIIWDSKHEDRQLFDWVSNTDADYDLDFDLEKLINLGH